MKILIVRHAIAMEKDVFARTGQDDSKRPLTREGAAKMIKAAKGLKKILPHKPLIASSPWTRAVQTADILSKTFSVKKIHVHSDFEPGADYRKRLKRLAALKSPLVILTGHEPDLSCFVSWLLNGDESMELELKKGGVVMIDFDGKPKAGEGILAWALPPKVLRALGA